MHARHARHARHVRHLFPPFLLKQTRHIPDEGSGVTLLSHTASVLNDVTLEDLTDNMGRKVGGTYKCNGTGMVKQIYDVTFQVRQLFTEH